MCPKISFNISQPESSIKYYTQLLFLSLGEESRRNSEVRATEWVLPVEQIGPDIAHCIYLLGLLFVETSDTKTNNE